jgi:hypothetical protein
VGIAPAHNCLDYSRRSIFVVNIWIEELGVPLDAQW